MPTNNLSWTPAGGAVTSQKVKRSTSPNPTTTLATVGATASTYADTTAVAKNDYYYLIESICANGDAVSNEVTICNDGDVSAAISLGGINYDDTNSPYSGFVLDNYSGNVYGGHADGPNGSQAHHLIVHDPSNSNFPNQFLYSSNYNPTAYPYGYCDGIFGAFNVDEFSLPGTYASTYFYIALGIERSSDNGVTKEIIGTVDPSTDAVMRTVFQNNSATSDEGSGCTSIVAFCRSYINAADQTVNFRPTGTDSIYYTLYPVVDANISPVTVNIEKISGSDAGSTCTLGIYARMGAMIGVTESGTDYDFSGVKPQNATSSVFAFDDTGWKQPVTSTTVVTGTTTSALRNKVLNASNDLYVTIDAYTSAQYGQISEVTATYTVNNGNPITLGTIYGPAYSGNANAKTSQTYTISRSAGDKINIKILGQSGTGSGGA